MKLELVRGDPLSPTDIVQALQKLIDDARTGQYTGFVIGLTRPRRRYSVHCVGEACESPSWARGIVAAIDDELAAMIASDDRDTTF